MGTVNNSFNLSDILGAFSSSQGINVQAAVASAIAAESGPLNQWENEQAALQSQTGDINVIEGNLTTLQNALNALGDPAGSLLSMDSSSSNSNVVTASVAPGATPGNHVVVVNSVATTGSWYSDEVASGDTDLTDGGFTLQVGSNAPVQITYGPDGSAATLNDLATYINGLGAGVSANVVSDGTGARLSIVSNNSGAANDVTISGETGLNFTRASTGADASLTVDGIPVDSPTNTVTGVVSGVTFNLVSADPGVPVNVSATEDVSTASQAVTAFVNAYNAVVQNVNQEYTVGANGAQGPLAGDSTLSLLQDIMLGSGSYSDGSTSGIATLADLGITMNNDGTLTLDTGTLDNAMQSNFSAVQNFFQGTSSNGFANSLTTQLNTMTDPTNGAFTVDLQSISSENTDLQNQINDFQAYLATQTTLLTNEYNQADALLQQLPIEEQQINAELSGLNGSSNNNSGG
ncbi:MAG TPA: flagellar filament capping protein FliD [Terriglobales bacterium]|jgi:flagellar hook-associated protein 2|nr:flagellar filament capping protein FliD [Terriglobales bacterium]